MATPPDRNDLVTSKELLNPLWKTQYARQGRGSLNKIFLVKEPSIVIFVILAKVGYSQSPASIYRF